MAKIDIYLSKDFLQQYFNDFTKLKESQEIKYWWQIESLLFSDKTNLIDVVSYQIWNKNDVKRRFKKTNQKVLEDLNRYSIDITYIKNIPNPFSFFCIEYSKTKSLQKKIGFAFTNIKNYIETYKWLSNQHTDKNILVNTSPKWKDFLRIKHPFNSLIINDIYISTWDKKQVKENIFPIVSKLIYQKSIEKLNLTIICGFTQESRKHSDNPENIFKLIKHKFSQSYNAVVTLICIHFYKITDKAIRDDIKEPFHNRYIFTNYCQLVSGHSFNQETNINICPIIESNNIDAISRKLIKYKESISSAKLYSIDTIKIYGNMNIAENNLLNL